MTDFIIELDRLYAFEINEDLRFYPSVGGISFSETGGRVSGLEFSYDGSNRLERETLKEEIIRKYVISLKMRGFNDSAVPQDVWDKYSTDGEYEGP